MPGFLARLGKLFCCDRERGHWPGRFDFILAAISYTMGINQVWRTPYMQYRNGGAAHLIPHIFFIVVIGLPLVFFEVSLGQFTSSGALTCWKFAPFIQGMGLGMVFISAIVTFTYSTICATTVYYMFASFTLPWSECGQEWSTQPCRLGTEKESSTMTNDWWNSTYVAPTFTKSLSQEYLHRHVLQDEFSTGIDDLGPVVWHLALCSLFVWIIVALCLSKSVRSYGKAAYFTTICPLVILIILFIHGLTLDGHAEGFKYFTFPNSRRLDDVRVWYEAGYGTWIDLSLSYGGLITLASYNKFNNDSFRDSAFLCAWPIVMTFLFGSMVFFYFGASAYAQGQDVSHVVSAGSFLAYSAIPEIFLMTGAPALWSFLWFLMLTCLCFGTLLGMVETVLTAILDVIPRLRRYRPLVVIGVCTLLFLLGIPMSTQGGWYWTKLIDFGLIYVHSIMFPILIIVALHIYGIPRFLNDVEIMVGKNIFWCIPVIIGKVIMGFFLFFPTLVVVVCIYVVVRMLYRGIDSWPLWAFRLAFAMNWTIPIIIVCGGLFSIYQARTRLRGNWFAFMTPTPDWGPALPEHRALMLRYVPWYKLPPSDGASTEVPSTTTPV